MITFITHRLKTISPLQYFVVITIISLLIFLVKLFGIKEDYRLIRVEIVKKNWIENYDPYGYRAPFWLSDKIKVGMTEKNPVGKNIAEVLKVENYIRGGQDAQIYLTLKAKVVYNKRLQRYTYKDAPLDLGSPIDLNLDTVRVIGQIIDDNVPPEGYPTKTIVVTARGRNFSPAEVSNVVPGLKMYERANNKVVAEVIEVKVEPSTQVQTSIDRFGNLYQNINQNKDVIITVNLEVVNIDNRWYFSGHSQIKPNHQGDLLYLFTDKMDLPGLLIESVDGL